MRIGVAAGVLVTACVRPADPQRTSESSAPATTPAPIAAAAAVPESRAAEGTAAPHDASPAVPADPSGVRPPVPDPSLAALPVDLRLPDETTLLRDHQRECTKSRKGRCEQRIELDGDGVLERVFLVRARKTRHLGIAVVWGRGGVSLIAADARIRYVETEVFLDGVEVGWGEIEDDMEIERWHVAEVGGDAPAKPRKASASGPESLERDMLARAPARVGGGVLVSNGESTTIFYWDGAGWRRLVLF